MEWIILVIGILGLGAAFSNAMDVSENTGNQQSNDYAGGLASVNQTETGRGIPYSDEETE